MASVTTFSVVSAGKIYFTVGDNFSNGCSRHSTKKTSNFGIHQSSLLLISKIIRFTVEMILTPNILQEEQLSIMRNKPKGALLTHEDLKNMSYSSKVK